MEKAEIKSRIDSIREGAEKDREKNNYKAKENPGKNPEEKKIEGKVEKKIEGKICPFSLASGKARQCGNWCQLYREGKKFFSCPLQEVSTISWNTRR